MSDDRSNKTDTASECTQMLLKAADAHHAKELALANMSVSERECRLWWDREAVRAKIYPLGDARFEDYLKRNGWSLVDKIIAAGFFEYFAR